MTCVTISITDDETVENTEHFTEILTRSDMLDSRVQLGLSNSTIEITDDDGSYKYHV